MIYAFLNQKGGVGKTTLSVHVADVLARRGSRVLLIDADPQQSSINWSRERAQHEWPESFSVVAKAVDTLHKEIGRLSANYDHVIIDGPPRVHEVAKSIILAADIIVIPVQPSPQDIWATAETIDLVREAHIFKETQKSVIVINRKVVNTAIGRDVRETLATLKTPVLSADISQRVAFAEAFASGRTVADLDPRSAAAREVEDLVTELVRDYVQENNHDSAATGRVVLASR